MIKFSGLLVEYFRQLLPTCGLAEAHVEVFDVDGARFVFAGVKFPFELFHGLSQLKVIVEVVIGAAKEQLVLSDAFRDLFMA